MSESYTTVKHTSWLGNILNSVVGAFVGLLIFVLAFPLIWFGEGRTNMAEVAARSVPVSATAPEAANEGQLVAITGELEAEPLGDPQFLAPGAYLRLERVVEMFAWEEDSRTERQDNLGGGSTERTTYTYELRWTSSPESGESFHQSSGYRNPSMPVEEATFSAEGGQLGAFAVDLGSMGLPSASEVALAPAQVIKSRSWRLQGNYLFNGKGAPESPRHGDVRISYRAVPAGARVTAFGEQRGERLQAYHTEQGDELYRALDGGREEAIKQLQVEDTVIDWALRIGSLLMIWIGLMMLFGPANALLGVLPALKQAGGCLTSLLTFVVAFALWAVAELVAIIAHNPWLLLGTLVLLLAGGFFLARRFQPAARSQPAASA
jgi:hypothetical protein